MKCIMCDSDIHLDSGYVTDGKVNICRDCAESNSLTRIITRIENLEVDANLSFNWEAPIDQTSLVDQTVSDGDLLPYPDNNGQCDLSPCIKCEYYQCEINECTRDAYSNGDATPEQVEAFFTSSGPDFLEV